MAPAAAIFKLYLYDFEPEHTGPDVIDCGPGFDTVWYHTEVVDTEDTYIDCEKPRQEKCRSRSDTAR